MNVMLPNEEKMKWKRLIIYVTIMVICIIAVIIAFYVQFYARIDFGTLMGIYSNKYGDKSEDQIQILKAEFDEIFTNNIENEEGQDSKKKEKDKPLIYTELSKKESKVNSYDVEVYIPHINIDSEIIDAYNQEIEEVFANKTESILKSENQNSIYTVEYVANVEYDILSLMIRSNLKEGSSAQRVIIQTYNYDLRNNKEISLEEVLKVKNINISQTQEKINSEIESAQRKVQELKDLGYNIYSRNLSNEIYQIENSKEFYLTDQTLYIVYAYGNDTFTSEMDLIVI